MAHCYDNMSEKAGKKGNGKKRRGKLTINANGANSQLSKKSAPKKKTAKKVPGMLLTS